MYACYCVYNVEATIRQSLESVLPYVEKVVAVDGVYSGYPHKDPFSTDATQKLFSELCPADKLIWVSTDKAWPSQLHKRNEYLKYVPNNKWFLVIDGDEFIRGKVAEGFKFAESSRHNCIGVKLQNHLPNWPGLKIVRIGGHPCISGEPIPRHVWNTLSWKKYFGVGTRLYRKIEGMEYRDHHSRIFVGQKTISRAQAKLRKVLMVNLNYKMGWERWRNNIEYKYVCRKLEEKRLRSAEQQRKTEAWQP